MHRFLSRLSALAPPRLRSLGAVTAASAVALAGIALVGASTATSVESSEVGCETSFHRPGVLASEGAWQIENQSQRGTLRTVARNVATGRTLDLGPTHEHLAAPSVSLDGRRLGWVRCEDQRCIVTRVDLDSGTETSTALALSSRRAGDADLELDASGRYLAVIESGDLVVVDLEADLGGGSRDASAVVLDQTIDGRVAPAPIRLRPLGGKGRFFVFVPPWLRGPEPSTSYRVDAVAATVEEIRSGVDSDIDDAVPRAARVTDSSERFMIVQRNARRIDLYDRATGEHVDSVDIKLQSYAGALMLAGGRVAVLDIYRERRPPEPVGVDRSSKLTVFSADGQSLESVRLPIVDAYLGSSTDGELWVGGRDPGGSSARSLVVDPEALRVTQTLDGATPRLLL